MKALHIGALLLLSVNMGCSQPKGKPASAKTVAEFKVGNQMDEKGFWKIIDYSYNIAGDDKHQQDEIITKKLSAYSPEQIVEFEVILEKKVIEANDFKVMAADKIIEGLVTDDPYLYFRFWLIGLGEKTFKETLRNPDYLAGVVEKGVEPDFESLLYVSTKAYMNKTGKKTEDDTFPRSVAFKKGLNYDLGGPATTGKEWKTEDLPTLYPKLWEKFN
ncbi:DUF4240 domain-containing protein [Mucilaginibacter sp.]|uniref:DUF4240 domain-containing protein n=1 Tax=Mucilaginibacter sp. TaxID=1882438 RepID=UPI0032675256